MPRSTLVSTSRTAGLSLAAVVFLFKLPLLGEGFGSDPDAWRAFAASTHLAATGEYIPSRLPGYPLPEYVGALFVSIGITTPLVFNLIAALLSAICALLIFRLVLAFGIGRALGAAALFSLVPVVVIAGTSNVDYLWGLAFFLGAALALDVRHIPMTALLLGLAAASRPTYALGIVPLLAMFFMQPDRTRRDKLVGVLTLVAISGATAVAFFGPVLWHYRANFLAFPNAVIPWPIMLGNMSVRTFGVIGSIALALVVGAWPRAIVTAAFSAPVRLFFFTSLLVYAGLFLRLPLEAGYLIPALPGLCVLLALALPQRVLGILCAVMVVSCFVLHIDRSAVADGPGTIQISRTESIEIHLAGPVLNDLHERRTNACIAKAGGAIADALGDDERLAVGGYLPVMQAMLPPATLEKIVYGARRAPDGGYIVHESGEKLPAGKKFVYLDKAEHFLAIAFDAPMARVASTAECR